MKLKVSAPIHAATAMLTATVTAMSMIEATTGLRAFLLLRIFIFVLIPPFGVVRYVNRDMTFKSYDSLHHIWQLHNKNTRSIENERSDPNILKVKKLECTTKRWFFDA